MSAVPPTPARPLRLVHTGDWHLGHRLHDVPRDEEHRLFLAWLLDLLEREAADALLVCGDVFDTANPSAAAQRAWYRFLAQASQRVAGLDVLVIAGNHDSAARLEAPAAILEALSVRVVGAIPRGEGGILDVERLVVPLHDRDGIPRAQVAAVPFLRPADLPRGPRGEEEDGGLDPMVEGVRAVYASAIAAARARAVEESTDAPAADPRPQAVLATGHLYLVGTALSELSERKILGGNQHALPHDLFEHGGGVPDYVALGHLHLAQSVASDRIRYAGSPLPLSLAERTYRHQVLVVDIEGPGEVTIREERVPRAVPLLRIPQSERLPLGELLPALRALEVPPAASKTLRPLVEVAVQLEAPEPRLRSLVEEAVADKGVRLVRIDVATTGQGESLGEQAPGAGLRDLAPETVFELCYRRTYDDEPADDLRTLFGELVEAAQHGAGAPAGEGGP